MRTSFTEPNDRGREYVYIEENDSKVKREYIIYYIYTYIHLNAVAGRSETKCIASTEIYRYVFRPKFRYLKNIEKKNTHTQQ